MSSIQSGLSSIVLAMAFLLPAPSRAAESDGVITGAGTVVIKRQPQVLRGQFVVTGEAKDGAGAIAKLKEAQGIARQKLAEMGALEKSIDIGPTQMGGAPMSAREQYAQYMQELQRSMGQPNGGARAAAKPQTVTVSSILKAEWALAGGSADELFISGSALKEKIKAAGIGKKDLKKLTPEQLEVEEETAAKNGGAGANEPSFQFACKISDVDRAAALAEAYGKAKHEAAELATASGTELAALRHLSKLSTSPTAIEDPDQTFKKMMTQQMTGGAPSAAETPTDEASAPAPTSVELQITVTASFGVK